MTSHSLAFRLITSAALWCGFALIVGGYALASIFQDTVVRRFDERLIANWESLVASAELDEQGRIVNVGLVGDLRFQEAFSGWYWQVTPVGESGGRLDYENGLNSRSLWDGDLQLSLDTPSTQYQQSIVAGPEGQSLRLVARKIRLPNADQPYVIAVAGDQAEIDIEASRFNAFLIWALIALGGGLIIALVIQVRVGLGPLAEVQRALAAIRTGKAQKLDGDFPSEIKPLAQELNALIKHNSEVVERSRTQVGNLAHALKTPLTVMANEVKRNPGELADIVDKQTDAMRTHVDHYLARARAAASAQVIGARTPVAPVLQDLSRTMQKMHANRTIKIDLEIEPGLAFRGERQDFEEMVGNLLDNAFKWANKKVQLTAKQAVDENEPGGQPSLVVEIDDDGAGLTEAERLKVMQRGARLDETVSGSGLGLSIVSDINELYGGAFHIRASKLGGIQAQLCLPAA